MNTALHPLHAMALKSLGDLMAAEVELCRFRKIDVYRCPACRELHENASDAGECCPPEPEVGFQCRLCHLIHQTADAAERCCDRLPSIARVGALPAPYACPICSVPHDQLQDAVDCCLWVDLAPDERRTVAQRLLLGAPWIDAIQAAREGEGAGKEGRNDDQPA